MDCLLRICAELKENKFTVVTQRSYDLTAWKAHVVRSFLIEPDSKISQIQGASVWLGNASETIACRERLHHIAPTYGVVTHAQGEIAEANQMKLICKTTRSYCAMVLCDGDLYWIWYPRPHFLISLSNSTKNVEFVSGAATSEKLIEKTLFKSDPLKFDRYIQQVEIQQTGTFCEIGSSDPLENNTTWSLEQKGWTGICVVSPDLVQPFQQKRPDCLVKPLWTNHSQTFDWHKVLGLVSTNKNVLYVTINDPKLLGCLQSFPFGSYNAVWFRTVSKKTKLHAQIRTRILKTRYELIDSQWTPDGECHELWMAKREYGQLVLGKSRLLK